MPDKNLFNTHYYIADMLIFNHFFLENAGWINFCKSSQKLLF